MAGFCLVCTSKITFAQTDTIKKQLTFIDDEGFITKEEGLAFLLVNSLIDTTEKSQKGWNKINPTDTIGRYYRIENSGNYLICLPYSLNYFQSKHYVIEVTPFGELQKSELYDFGGSYQWNNYYKFFFLQNGCFLICAQGGYGAGMYYFRKLYLFKELVPQDSLTYIREGESKIFKKNKFSKKATIIHGYSGWTHVEKNKLGILYELYRGKVVKDKKDDKSTFQYNHKVKRLFVEYFYEDGKWSTKDTNKLKKIDRFMKVPSGSML